MNLVSLGPSAFPFDLTNSCPSSQVWSEFGFSLAVGVCLTFARRLDLVTCDHLPFWLHEYSMIVEHHDLQWPFFVRICMLQALFLSWRTVCFVYGMLELSLFHAFCPGQGNLLGGSVCALPGWGFGPSSLWVLGLLS